MEDKIINTAKRTIGSEVKAISVLLNYINDDFVKTISLIHGYKGRLVISGIGKSAIVAQKIVSSLNSTGTPSLFLHSADAIHGDIGMEQKDDIVMIISKSGESPEIKVLISLFRNFKIILVAMCCNMQSYLAKCADIILNTTVSEEAYAYNPAPTTSTTAQIVLGDATTVCLMDTKGFGSAEFAKFHPGGALGKRLYLHVGDLSLTNGKPSVHAESLLKDVIIEITKKRLGATAVVDRDNKILGIITDGDLRRMLEKDVSLKDIKASDIMSASPKTIDSGELAVNALDHMRTNNITQLLVTANQEYSGIIHLHDLVREGII